MATAREAVRRNGIDPRCDMRADYSRTVAGVNRVRDFFRSQPRSHSVGVCCSQIVLLLAAIIFDGVVAAAIARMPRGLVDVGHDHLPRNAVVHDRTVARQCHAV